MTSFSAEKNQSRSGNSFSATFSLGTDNWRWWGHTSWNYEEKKSPSGNRIFGRKFDWPRVCLSIFSAENKMKPVSFFFRPTKPPPTNLIKGGFCASFSLSKHSTVTYSNALYYIANCSRLLDCPELRQIGSLFLADIRILNSHVNLNSATLPNSTDLQILHTIYIVKGGFFMI